MQPTIGLAPRAKLARVKDENEAPWVCTTSAKASRTGKNDSMENILKPIIDNIKPGFQRADKKDPIALAVRESILICERNSFELEMIHLLTAVNFHLSLLGTI